MVIIELDECGYLFNVIGDKDSFVVIDYSHLDLGECPRCYSDAHMSGRKCTYCDVDWDDEYSVSALYEGLNQA